MTLVAIVLLGVAMAVVVLLVATSQPWLGITLSARDGEVRIVSVSPTGPASAIIPGSVLRSVASGDGQLIELLPGDLVEEPDVAESYEALAQFLDRQDRLHAALTGPTVTLDVEGPGTEAAQPTPVTMTPALQRPVTSLPAVFWVQIATGLVSLSIGAWVWSLRPKSLPTRLLLAAGFFIPVSAFPAAIYSTREIALDGEFFRLLSAINHLGALGFGVAMVALFLVYPRRLVPLRLLLLLPLAFGAIWVLGTARLFFPGPAEGVHLPVVLLMIGIIAGAFMQFRATRDDPVARAALTWFALSVAVCGGTFVVIVLVPNLFGVRPTVSQGYAFVLFLLLFVGVAAGVARYRLFELGEWAFRILYYIVGMVLLILADALLIYIMAVDYRSAFGLSLVLVALLYLPMRDWVWRRWFARRRARSEDLFRATIDVALTPTGKGRGAAWEQLLTNVFAPLTIAPAEDDIRNVAIADEGLALFMPAVDGLPSLRLSHAYGGRALFSPRDKRLAEDLSAVLDHTGKSREAHDRGVAEERTRVARDMHDNIGAQLISALHSGVPAHKDDLIRGAITDIRDIINNARMDGQNLAEALAEMRLEAARRLELAGIRLDWRIDETAARVTRLAPHVVHGLRSILREAITNIIRHAEAGAVAITAGCTQGGLTLAIADDGKGMGETGSAGSGLANMRSRAAAIGGSLEIADGAHGTTVTLRTQFHGGRET